MKGITQIAATRNESVTTQSALRERVMDKWYENEKEAITKAVTEQVKSRHNYEAFRKAYYQVKEFGACPALETAFDIFINEVCDEIDDKCQALFKKAREHAVVMDLRMRMLFAGIKMNRSNYPFDNYLQWQKVEEVVKKPY